MSSRIFGCLALVASWLAAQTNTAGNIVGIIRDPAGAAVGNAEVSARHTETGLVRQTTTGPDGRFILPSLPAGAWELRVNRSGFSPLLRKGIILSVGETVALDLQLTLGSFDQEITITESAPLVSTQTSELSYLVSEGAIRILPLNGRNYTDLALLQPGVVAFPHRDGGSVVAHGLAQSINGQDPRSNVYLLDGTPLNDFTNGPAGSAAGTALGMETIREFRVETNAYSAEFGRNSGGQINALSKSGTNEFHGSLYHYLRNDNLDARNFFDPARMPDFKRNQFGGSLGGPLRRDRTFFFGGYEGLRERLGRTISTVVPDLQARNGIIDGVPYAVHPAVRPYLEEFPLPNGPNLGRGLAAYSFGFNQELNEDFFQARVDHNWSAAHSVFVRYTTDKASQRLPTDFPQFPRSFLSHNHFVTAELQQVLSPQTLNNLRLGFSRTRIGQDVEANTSRPLPPFIPGRNMMGAIDIGGIPRFGPQSSVNVRLVQNVYGFEDGLSLSRGRHFLKTGALIERYQDNMYNPTFGLGIFTFGDLAEFLQNRPQRFLGLPPAGALDRYWRFTLFGFYLQNDYKAAPRLTLNLGLRYEFTTMPVDIYGRDSALPRLTDPAPTVGQLYQNPTKKNFSPRFGLAWDVFGTGRISLRAGYAWFFNTNNQQNLIVTVTNPPATPRISIANPTFPVPQFERGVGNTIRPVQWDIKNPNVHQWNINVQQQLWGGFLITVGYAGARGIHLWRSSDVNLPVPQRLADGTLFFPAGAPRFNPAFSTIELKSSDGNSWYNALIFEIRRRWSGGFNFQSSYTFSRNIDTTQASTFFSDATNGTTSAMPEFPGFSYNKGLADFHAQHNWVVNGSWEIPFGRTLRGTSGFILRGWQLSAISHVRSGNPLTVFVQRNRSRSQWAPSLAPGIGFDRPSMAPGRTHKSAILGSPDRYFDPSAFILQPAGTLGNLGRGAFIGPNLRSLDLAFLKNFRLGFNEQAHVQFRAEAFNLFNHPNFGPPQLIVFAGAADNEPPLSSFGRIRSAVTSARQIQLALRLSF